MKSIIVLLAVLSMAVAAYREGQHEHHEGEHRVQRERRSGSCNDPDTLIDTLLQDSRQDSETDRSELDDIEIRFRYPGSSPRHPGVRGRITLRRGQLSGITQQAQRQGKSESEKLEEGNKCAIHACLQHRKLRVEYEDVDIRTEPDQRVDADSYEGYLHNVQAYLGLEYNEDKDDLQLKYYAADEAERTEFTLKGAERERRENPLIEREALRQIHKVVEESIKEQMKDIIKGYGEDSAK